jgi:hypothetical protein
VGVAALHVADLGHRGRTRGAGHAVALFAAALFLGSAAGTALFAVPAEAGAFGQLFLIAAVAAAPVAALCALGRAAYARR